ncbi:Cyclic nucleotide-binding protein [Pseudocohnilembus persalinus]|uniref:Cyclic nucleotide-binding protein n=1 Tax=Pseudocohnilembus persalinus TaxID=266149 RepID=A0A0V0R2X5_PSEPJ|nr:Cyclic nucleotide-binding protein [Pseudocohnilembus persalinus]|eukprot:KRX08536.1 Cyclic nucleotide-binding protein [Pseudocohnilembus persalinus]
MDVDSSQQMFLGAQKRQEIFFNQDQSFQCINQKEEQDKEFPIQSPKNLQKKVQRNNGNNESSMIVSQFQIQKNNEFQTQKKIQEKTSIDKNGFHYVAQVGIRNGVDNNWLTMTGIENTDWKIRYVESIYFAIVTAVTVGYGDIHPVSQQEKLFVIVFTLISCGQFAYTVNTIGTIFLKQQQKEENYKRTEFELTNYLANRQIDQNIQIKLLKYIRYMDKNKNYDIQKGEEILSRMPKEIRDQFKINFFGKQIPWFLQFSVQTRQNFCLKMKEKIYSPGEIIFQNNQLDKRLVILRKGAIQLQISDEQQSQKINITKQNFEKDNLNYKIVKTLQQTSIIELRDFLNYQARTLEARSLGITSIIYIDNQDFEEVLRKSVDSNCEFEKFQYLKNQYQFKTLNVQSQNCHFCKSCKHDFENCKFLFYKPKEIQEIFQSQQILYNQEINQKLECLQNEDDQTFLIIMKEVRFLNQIELELESDNEDINLQDYIEINSEIQGDYDNQNLEIYKNSSNELYNYRQNHQYNLEQNYNKFNQNKIRFQYDINPNYNLNMSQGYNQDNYHDRVKPSLKSININGILKQQEHNQYKTPNQIMRQQDRKQSYLTQMNHLIQQSPQKTQNQQYLKSKSIGNSKDYIYFLGNNNNEIKEDDREYETNNNSTNTTPIEKNRKYSQQFQKQFQKTGNQSFTSLQNQQSSIINGQNILCKDIGSPINSQEINSFYEIQPKLQSKQSFNDSPKKKIKSYELSFESTNNNNKNGSDLNALKNLHNFSIKLKEGNTKSYSKIGEPVKSFNPESQIINTPTLYGQNQLYNSQQISHLDINLPQNYNQIQRKNDKTLTNISNINIMGNNFEPKRKHKNTMDSSKQTMLSIHTNNIIPRQTDSKFYDQMFSIFQKLQNQYANSKQHQLSDIDKNQNFETEFYNSEFEKRQDFKFYYPSSNCDQILQKYNGYLDIKKSNIPFNSNNNTNQPYFAKQIIESNRNIKSKRL